MNAQRFQQGGEFVVGFHEDTVDGKNDAVSITDEIGGMRIEDGDLIEVAIERQRAAMARAESREPGKVPGGEEGQHLIASGGVADESGLRGDDDQPCGLAADTDEAHVVGEEAIGEQQPVQILGRQRMSERGLAVGGDDCEAVMPGVGGFVINVVTATDAMFLTAVSEFSQRGRGV